MDDLKVEGRRETDFRKRPGDGGQGPGRRKLVTDLLCMCVESREGQSTLLSRRTRHETEGPR